MSECNEKEELKEQENFDKIYTQEEVDKIKELSILKTSCILSLVFCIILGGLFAYWMSILNTYPDDTNILKYLNILKLYDENYIGDFDLETAVDSSLIGLVKGVEDKYGGYISKDNSTITGSKIKTGNYQGIGITYDISNADKGFVELIEVLENSPAGKAGLKVGDRVTKIDNKVVSLQVIQEFSNSVHLGEKEKVVFEINSEKDVELEIGLVKPQKVIYEIQGKTGYLTILTFVMDTVSDFQDAIDYLIENKVERIVFDVRGNSGGDVNAIVEILDYMLKDCLLLTMENNKQETKSLYSDEIGVLPENIDIVILVDNATASASELFTMVMQEQRDAIVMGQKTFGKSTVLTFFTFNDGSMLAMSTGFYYPESGRYIEGEGIEPDILLSDIDIRLSAFEIIQRY